MSKHPPAVVVVQHMSVVCGESSLFRVCVFVCLHVRVYVCICMYVSVCVCVMLRHLEPSVRVKCDWRGAEQGRGPQ